MDNASLSSALVYISFASSSARRRTCSCGLFSALAMIGDSGVGKTEYQLLLLWLLLMHLASQTI